MTKIHHYRILVAFVVSFLSIAVIATATSVTDNTFVSADDPTGNYGDVEYLEVRDSGATSLRSGRGSSRSPTPGSSTNGGRPPADPPSPTATSLNCRRSMRTTPAGCWLARRRWRCSPHSRRNSETSPRSDMSPASRSTRPRRCWGVDPARFGWRHTERCRRSNQKFTIEV